MKRQITLLVLCLAIFACNSEKKTDMDNSLEDTKIDLTIEGNWELIGYYNYQDNEVVDSFKTNEGFRQVKMYQDNKVMWSKVVPSDSSEWFGYGKFTVSNDTLTEVLDYGSEAMREIIAEKKQFVHKLIFEGDKFIQIELDEDGNYVYSENYRRIK